MTGVALLKPTAESAEGKERAASDAARKVLLAGLLTECGQGDRRAFKQLYELTASTIFGLLVTVLRDREVAREVAQEVYVTVWKKSSTFDRDKGNALSWMSTIARNRAIDRIRAERARGFVQFTDEVPDMADLGPSAEVSADAVAVRRALGNLRPEYRKAVLLSYFNGYTNSELADVMEIPVGTAKTWIRRGLQDLKEALA